MSLRFPSPRPADLPDVNAYLKAVKEHYEHDQSTYTQFLDNLNRVRDWGRGDASSDDIIELVLEVSRILRRNPRLLRDYNSLLPQGIWIEPPTDVEVVETIVVVLPLGAKVYSLSGSEAPAPATTDELHRMLCSEHGWKQITTQQDSNKSQMGTLAQLLQLGLDGVFADRPSRRKALWCLQDLATKSILPPSLFLHNVSSLDVYASAGGGFADIYRGKMSDRMVCLKVLRVFSGHSGDQNNVLKQFSAEVLVWRQLAHPNVLPFLGISKELFPHRFCLISPWMSHGNIMTYLAKNPGHDRLASIIEIAEGLRYLHELDPPIVHGDIKGANILVSDDRTCCLADFGLAHAIETQQGNRSSTIQGSTRWLSPELLDPFTYPAKGARPAGDIYAFGCTIYEICTGEPPFSELKIDAAVVLAVLSGKRPELPPPKGYYKHSTDLWTLLEACWTAEPMHRPKITILTQKLQDIIVPPAPTWSEPYNRAAVSTKTAFKLQRQSSTSTMRSTHEENNIPSSRLRGRPSISTLRSELLRWASLRSQSSVSTLRFRDTASPSLENDSSVVITNPAGLSDSLPIRSLSYSNAAPFSSPEDISSIRSWEGEEVLEVHKQTPATKRLPRTIALCFDSQPVASDQAFQNSNLARFVYALQKANHSAQLVCYKPDITSIVDVDAHIEAGCLYILENYRQGDKVFLFGYSLGAYVARGVAGKLSKAQVTVDFVGVWETIAPVQPPMKSNISYNDNIKVFRQALALDEDRPGFRPLTWSGSPLVWDMTDDDSPSSIGKCDILEVWFAGTHDDIGGSSDKSLSDAPLQWMIRECSATHSGLLFDRHSLQGLDLEPLKTEIMEIKDVEGAMRHVYRSAQDYAVRMWRAWPSPLQVGSIEAVRMDLLQENLISKWSGGVRYLPLLQEVKVHKSVKERSEKTLYRPAAGNWGTLMDCVMVKWVD